jgi:hypothetical protein
MNNTIFYKKILKISFNLYDFSTNALKYHLLNKILTKYEYFFII